MERNPARPRRAISYCRLKQFTNLHKDTSAIDEELQQLHNELGRTPQLRPREDCPLSFKSIFDPPQATANLQVVLADKTRLEKKLRKTTAANLRLARRLRASHGIKQRVRRLTWTCSQKDRELEALRKRLEQAKHLPKESRTQEAWSLRVSDNPFEASLDRSIDQLRGSQTPQLKTLSDQLNKSQAQAAKLLAKTEHLERERAALQQQLQASQEEREKLEEENQYLKESCELLLTEQQELLEMDNMIHALETDLDQTEQGHESHREEAALARAECEQLQGLVESLKQELADLQHVHEGCLQQRRTLEAQTRKLEAQLANQSTGKAETNESPVISRKSSSKLSPKKTVAKPLFKRSG